MTEINEITTIMNDYRECVRHLWNTYFQKGYPNLTPQELVYAFEFDKISEKLFEELVLRKIGMNEFRKAEASEMFPFIQIKPIADRIRFFVSTSRSLGGNVQWEERYVSILASESILNFVRYFDWDEFGCIDLKYYEVIFISGFDDNLIGSRGLIETNHATAHFVKSD